MELLRTPDQSEAQINLETKSPVQAFIKHQQGSKDLDDKLAEAQFQLLCSYVGNQMSADNDQQKKYDRDQLVATTFYCLKG